MNVLDLTLENILTDFHANLFYTSYLRTCIHRRCVRIFERILLQTRQKFTGILSVWQEFLTQHVAKFVEKTYIDIYEYKL